MTYEEYLQEEITRAKKAEKEWTMIENDYDPNIGGKTGLWFGGNAEDFEE